MMWPVLSIHEGFLYNTVTAYYKILSLVCFLVREEKNSKRKLKMLPFLFLMWA